MYNKLIRYITFTVVCLVFSGGALAQSSLSVIIVNQAAVALEGTVVASGVHDKFGLVSGASKKVTESSRFVVNIKTSDGLCSQTLSYNDSSQRWRCNQGMLGCVSTDNAIDITQGNCPEFVTSE